MSGDMNRQFRVLHITGDSVLGGTESVLLGIARCQSLDCHTKHEFLMFPDGILRQQLEAFGAKTYLLGVVRLRNLPQIIKARQSFRRLLKSEKYDVVVFHQYAWMALILSGISRRMGCSNVRWFHNEIRKNHWTEAVLRFLQPQFPSWSFYCSNFLKNQTQDRCTGEVMYCPVAPSKQITSDERHAIRAELQTPDDSVVIIQVSRMGVRKGHTQLIKALGDLRQDSSWICWVVGGADSEEQRDYVSSLEVFTKKIGISDRVKFLGKRTDVPRLLYAADIFCQPNLPPPEPFGISFIEALYAGLPVVTTAMGGALEIIDESSGILVPAGNPESLAQALRALVVNRNLRESFRSSGPKRARELCDPKQQIVQLGKSLRRNVQSLTCDTKLG